MRWPGREVTSRQSVVVPDFSRAVIAALSTAHGLMPISGRAPARTYTSLSRPASGPG